MKRFFRKPYTVRAAFNDRDFMHLLPAQIISRAAMKARGVIRIGLGDASADAKDVFELLRLKAGPGSVFTISADDRADRHVVDALAALVRDGFGEK